jgi:hypothetical protein
MTTNYSLTKKPIIQRTNKNDDRANLMARDGAEQFKSLVTIRREKSATVLPPDGSKIFYDFYRNGADIQYKIIYH